MSAVIEFPLERTRQVERTGQMGSAAIIIFPGVRVERLMYDLAERLPAARTGKSQQQMLAGDFDFY